MADDDQEQEPTASPGPCMPCGGSGKVVSNAGGEPHEVTCPWCEGGGVVIPGHDAQAARRRDG